MNELSLIQQHSIETVLFSALRKTSMTLAQMASVSGSSAADVRSVMQKMHLAGKVKHFAGRWYTTGNFNTQIKK
jgi:predicted Rossmann fold nucleotide-binding protein DprA/Smf involved in DNA uptake